MEKRRRSERGMVTAETAMVVPFLVALTLALAAAAAVGITQVRLVDAAREGARMAARGDEPGEVVEGVQSMAPVGATVTTARRDDDTVEVTVRLRARVDLPVVRAFSLPLAASAVSAAEAAP
ncbi:TadE family type IV pilus minor pilin [Mumia sp. Pv 4-285]|uniref:TadE family type IV pilus minor pilin n=1 Tax=Mumia qirimensis TaxID=3234852 RepID=UPI00351D359D